MEPESVSRAVAAWRNGTFAASERNVPAETAVAISVNGSTHAVMMATPRDLRELAFGLALNERIVAGLDEIETVDCVRTEEGYDCRLWISSERASRYSTRRRQMTGPVGCGLCGVESLELARPDLPSVASRLVVAPAAIAAAMRGMERRQRLGQATRAVHAAGFADREGTCLATFEDVGRHNALDKLAGHLAQAAIDPASGLVTITSRVSVELIQKCAVMGCGLIAAVSVPTELAIEVAREAGVTLVAISRGDDFEVFTHPFRIEGAAERLSDPSTAAGADAAT